MKPSQRLHAFNLRLTVHLSPRRRAGALAVLLSLIAARATAAASGEPLAWGKYTHMLPSGQFETNNLVTPAGLVNVVELASGLQHAALLTTDGRVRVVGEWAWGQTNVPASLANVLQVSAGDYHTLARTLSGTVRAWGANYNGQCQVPASVSNSVMVAAGGYHSLSLSASGTLIGWGDNRYGQATVPAGLSNVAALAAGAFHSLALKTNGRVVAWGSNVAGQTNVPANLSNVVAIAARDHFSLALRSDGTLVGWGTNAGGQLNVPAGLAGITRIAAGEKHVVALRAPGELAAWGANSSGQTQVPTAATGCTAVAAGALHSVAVIGGAPPNFLLLPQPLTLLPGNAGALAGVALGTPPLTYQWRLAGTNLPGSTRPQLTLTNAGARHTGTYTLVVSNDWGVATAAADVLVAGNPPVIVYAPTDMSGVIGSAVHMEVEAIGTPPLTYQWSFSGHDLSGTTSSRLSFASLTFEDAGNYGVRVINDYGVATNDPVTLTVTLAGIPPSFTLSPTNTSTIIASPVTLAARAAGSAPLAWQWYHNGNAKPGATRASYSIAQTLASDAGQYFVTITNSYGAQTSAVAVLSAIGLPPAVSAQPLAVTTTVGATATLSVGATGTAPLLYQWQRAGTILSGATTSTLTLANAQTNQSGSYRARVNNNYGAVTSEVAAVLIEQPNPPVITVQPANSTNLVGECVTLTVAATGELPIGYQWKFNGAPISGATGSSFTLCPAATNHSGGYQVAVSNRWATVQSRIALLTVTYPPTPPAITAGPVSRTNLLGANCILSVTASGTGPLSYQWKKDGTPLADSTHILGSRSSLLTIAGFGPADTGTYMVTVTNVAGAASIAPVVQTLAPTNGNQAVFLGVDTNTSGNWKGIYGSSGYVVIGNLTNLPAGVSLAPAGATNALWAETAVVQALSKATSTDVNDRIAANWNNPTNLFFDLITDGTYDLAIYSLDWNSLGASQRVDILPSATGTPISTAVVSDFNMGKYLRFRVAGAVRVNVTSLKPIHTMISGIFFDAVGAPAITQQPVARTNVAGTTATFTVGAAGSPPLSYQWRFNGAPLADATASSLTLANVSANDAGDYTVVVSNGSGTVTSDVAILTVLRPPSIVRQPVGATVLRGAPAGVEVETTGTLPMTFVWFKDGIEVSGAMGPRLDIQSAHSEDTGDYSVVISNAYGSVTSGAAHLTVVIRAGILVQPQDQRVEAGQSIRLAAEVEGTGPLQRTWMLRGEPIRDAYSDTLIIAESTLLHAGDYCLIVSNAYGMATSRLALVEVSLPPNVPPIANDDFLLRPVVGARMMTAAELLANDRDPDGGVLWVAGVSAVTQRGGTARLDGTTITYTPSDASHLWDRFAYTIEDDRGGTAFASVLLQLDDRSNGSTASLVGIVPSATGQELRLTFIGMPNMIYQIEAAASPAGPWSVVATRTASAEGEFTFVDTGGGTQPSRFYRTAKP